MTISRPFSHRITTRHLFEPTTIQRREWNFQEIFHSHRLGARSDWAYFLHVCIFSLFFFWHATFTWSVYQWIPCTVHEPTTSLTSKHFMWELACQWVRCTVYRTHKSHFLTTFSLKMGHTALFTHLKKKIATMFSVFNFQQNNCIQTDPYY